MHRRRNGWLGSSLGEPPESTTGGSLSLDPSHLFLCIRYSVNDSEPVREAPIGMPFGNGRTAI